MIAFRKASAIEHFSAVTPGYASAFQQLSDRLSGPRSFVPLLLGVIRKESSVEIIAGVGAYTLASTNYEHYNVDLYAYDFTSTKQIHVFSHITSLGKSEENESKKELINAFNPNNVCIRVRLALRALQEGKNANYWLDKCQYEPVTKTNSADILILANYLAFSENTTHQKVMQAKSYFEKILIWNPNFEPALLGLSDILRLPTAGVPQDLPKAITLLETILKSTPKHSVALANLGDIYRKGGQGIVQNAPLAERYLLESMNTNPACIDTKIALACLYYLGGPNVEPNIQECHKHLLEARNLDPENSKVLNCLGDLYSANNVYHNPHKARKCFKKVLQQSPGNPIATTGITKVQTLESPVKSVGKRKSAIMLMKFRAHKNDQAAVEAIEAIKTQHAVVGRQIEDFLSSLKDAK